MSRVWGLATVLLACVPLAAGASPRVVRLALVVGANAGVGADRDLSYAQLDATRFAAVLREIGRHRRSGVQLLLSPSPKRVLAALRRLGRRVKRYRRRGRKVIFTFYYSGHANASELRMSGSVLPLAQLRAILARVSSDVRLVILDACHSGAFQTLARKGGRPAAPFRIRLVDDLQAKGEIVIASSASHEEAQESASLKGSFFTTHLISGLRGAADRDRDAQVTLAEAYGYAYAQTLRSTALSHAGLQHPRYLYDVSGKRDIVLAWPGGADGALVLKSKTEGPFLVFSGRGDVLYAEVSGEPGGATQIGLPRGRYLVHKRTTSGLLYARLRVKRGRRVVLDEGRMSVKAYAVTTPRGGRGGADWIGGTRSFSGIGLELRFSPIINPNFGGAYADTARVFGFRLGGRGGVDLSVAYDRSRWWSVALGYGYQGTTDTRRLDHLSLTSHRVFVDGYAIPLATRRFRLALGAGFGIYRSATSLGEVSQVGWVGGLRAGFRATFYVWSGFGIGVGYRYTWVQALQHDELGGAFEVGGHQITVASLSFRF